MRVPLGTAPRAGSIGDRALPPAAARSNRGRALAGGWQEASAPAPRAPHGLLEHPQHRALALPEQTTRKWQRRYGPTSEVTHQHLCHVLFLRNKPPSLVHSQGKGQVGIRLEGTSVKERGKAVKQFMKVLSPPTR